MHGLSVHIFLLGNVLYTLVKCCPLASQRMPRAITESVSYGCSSSGNTLSEFFKPVWEPKHEPEKQTLYRERKWKNPLSKQKKTICSIYMSASAFEFFRMLQKYQSWKKQYFTSSFRTSSPSLVLADDCIILNKM